MKNYRYILLPALFYFIITTGIAGQTTNAVTNSVCRLFADVGNTSSVITYIQEGEQVNVEEKYGDYYFIRYDSTGGFVLTEKIDLKGDAEYTDYSNPTMNEEVQDIPPDRYSMLIQKYGEETGNALYKLKIWRGINHNMVRDSWGKPFRVSREIKSDTVVEEWYYPKATLVFRNGILVDWFKIL